MVVEDRALQEDQGGSQALPMSAPRRREGRPDPEWVRGRCPECGDDLVSNLYYVGGRGYLLVWECWGSLGEDPQCRFRKVL